jgi:hypothetical protein
VVTWQSTRELTSLPDSPGIVNDAEIAVALCTTTDIWGVTVAIMGAIRKELVPTRLTLVDHTDIEQCRSNEFPLVTATGGWRVTEVYLVAFWICACPSQEPLWCEIAVTFVCGTSLSLRILGDLSTLGAVLNALVCQRL